MSRLRLPRPAVTLDGVRSATSSVLLGALLLATGGCSVGGDDPLTITAQFASTSGLFEGNDVGILGVPIGSITEIEPNGEIVDVTMEIDPEYDLPATAGAVITSRSVATDRYIEITPAFAEGPAMESGTVIPVERTASPVEFDEVLETLRNFSDGLRGPDGNATTLNELLEVGAATLEGRGQQINDTISDFAAAAQAISGNGDNIAGTITDLDELTTVLVENGETIDTFLSTVTEATELFASEQDDFGAALVSLSDALAAVAQFSVDNRSAIVATSRDLTAVLENLTAHRAELEESLETLPLTFQNIGNAVTDEGRLTVKLPPQYFSPVQGLTEALCEAIANLPLNLCEQLGTSPDILSLLQQLADLLTP